MAPGEGEGEHATPISVRQAPPSSKSVKQKGGSTVSPDTPKSTTKRVWGHFANADKLHDEAEREKEAGGG